MTARTPPPWRWGAWAERRELTVCLQSGGKRSRGKRRSSVGQNSSQSLSDTLWNMEDIVALIDARDERAKKIDAENAIPYPLHLPGAGCPLPFRPNSPA